MRHYKCNNGKYLPTHDDHSPQSSQQAGASHERSSVFVDSSGQGKPPLLGAMQDLLLVLVPVPPQETEQAYKLIALLMSITYDVAAKMLTLQCPQSSQQAGASHGCVSSCFDSAGQACPPSEGSIHVLTRVCVPVPPL